MPYWPGPKPQPPSHTCHPPQDVTVVAPAADVPRGVAAFSGWWAATLKNTLDHVLMVEKIVGRPAIKCVICGRHVSAWHRQPWLGRSRELSSGLHERPCRPLVESRSHQARHLTASHTRLYLVPAFGCNECGRGARLASGRG